MWRRCRDGAGHGTLPEASEGACQGECNGARQRTGKSAGEGASRWRGRWPALALTLRAVGIAATLTVTDLTLAGFAHAGTSALEAHRDVGAPDARSHVSAERKPARIVSLNLCTDELLVDLVPAGSIAALSRLAADPKLSTIAARAGEFRSTGGTAEEVLALDPDLVVTSEHAGPATVALLRRLGRRVVTVPLASDFEGYRTSVRALAAAVGDVTRGERLIADFDARLAASSRAASSRAASPDTGSRPGSARPTAVAWEINRLAAGGATLIDAAMQAAGLDNVARRIALGPGGTLPLESIVARPPDVLVLANAPDDYRTAAADNLRHPALAEAMRGGETVLLPMPLWLCATPRTAEAVERLVAARVRAEQRAVRK